ASGNIIDIKDDITTNDLQTYTGAVNLFKNTTLTGNGIIFNNTVNGNSDLTLNGGSANITLENTIGNTTSLKKLTTNGTGTTEIKANIITNDDQTYNTKVSLNQNTTLTADRDSNSIGTLSFNAEVLNVKILRIVSKLCIGIGDTKFGQLMTLFSIDNGFYLGKTQRL
ncbi:hypothetical protein, partial [Aphanizomenon sp. FACHB-1399]|uniref:hypothetical protein n=1 Tax=Aphanizomenon sp. FACHB-1399 TaxID=2692773 RepID=UPI0016821ED2